MEAKPPSRVEAFETSSLEPATIIFLHGFDDDSDGWTDVARQFQSARKLPHLIWVFPNAPFNHEARATAWCTPVAFSTIPKPTRSSDAGSQIPGHTRPVSPTPEEVQEERELMESVEVIDNLIEAEVKRGVKKGRILIGGFSQGCAVALLVGLLGRWRGQLAGVVGLSEYFPDGEWVSRRLKENLPLDSEGVQRHSGSNVIDGDVDAGGDNSNVNNKKMKVFLAHGTRDMLVPVSQAVQSLPSMSNYPGTTYVYTVNQTDGFLAPFQMWIFRGAKKRIIDVVGEDNVVAHQYEGMGHNSCGSEFRDMCKFLENVLS